MLPEDIAECLDCGRTIRRGGDDLCLDCERLRDGRESLARVSAITIDDLREYLTRRAIEAAQGALEAGVRAREFGRPARHFRHWIEIQTIGNARANLYRELIDIIDRGEFPE